MDSIDVVSDIPFQFVYLKNLRNDKKKNDIPCEPNELLLKYTLRTTNDNY